MTLLDLYKKVKRIGEYFNSADIPLKYNGNDFNIDFEFESKDAIVSHIEVKQNLVLTWEDMKRIDLCFHEVATEQTIGKLKLHSFQEMYEEVLRRFNQNRKK